MATSIPLKRSKYRLLGLVGQGQFGQVFCAIHRRTGQFVALKKLDRCRFPTHKFLRELRFLLSLQHPNIVTCQALEHTSTGRYLVMDYCEGGTLRHLMETHAPLTLSQKVALVMDVLSGLQQAHSRGIIHCDIKPENILLTLQPGAWTARISDFGIARLAQDQSTRSLGNTGSPAYMAPERFYGQYSQFSDLYSVGVLLFELLIGQRPFCGSPVELMSAHMNQPVRIPDALPTGLRHVLLTALQKLPARRFRSAEAMLEALQSIPIAELTALDQSIWMQSIEADLSIPTLQLGSPCECVVQQTEPLQAPLTALAVLSAQSGVPDPSQPRSLIQATEAQLTCKVYTADFQTEIVESRNSLSLPHPIRQVIPLTQRCLVVTTHSVDLLSGMSSSEPQTDLILQPILTCENSDLVTADPSGNWVAVATLPPLSASGKLTICRLPAKPEKSGAWLATSACLHRSVSYRSLTPFQLLPLDRHHLAVLSHDERRTGRPAKWGGQNQRGTTFEVFTRRGDSLGTIPASVVLHRAIATPKPYRVLALEKDCPFAVLLLDLKPFRAARIFLQIEPVCIATADWGYVFAASDGQIVLLNHEMEIVGHIAGPSHPTAIASFNGYGLLVATWNGTQGALHPIDLRQLDVNILF